MLKYIKHLPLLANGSGNKMVITEVGPIEKLLFSLFFGLCLLSTASHQNSTIQPHYAEITEFASPKLIL
jgi:hypothetical protein